MKGLFKKIICVITALSTFSTMSMNVSADEFSVKYTPQIPALNSPVNALYYPSYNSQEPHGTTNFGDLSLIYEHYDYSAFIEICKLIVAECDKNTDFSEIYNALSFLAAEEIYVQDLLTASLILYYSDTSNETYMEEASYTQQVVYIVHNALFETVKYVAESNDSYYSQLSEIMGEETLGIYLSYEDMSAEESEYNQKVSEIINNYYSYFNNNESDVEFAELYLESVKNNNKYAQYLGYDNYMQYAYDYYGRDYTIEDTKNYFKIVSENIAPLFSELVNKSKSYDNYNDFLKKSYTKEEVFSYIGEFADDISPEIMEAYNYMMEYQTYSAENLKDNPYRMDGAFSTYFSYFQTPYVYLTMLNNPDDITTAIHEFGHYNEFYQNGMTGYCVDLSEISSQALEMLYLDYYDEIYGEEYYEVACIKQIKNIVWSIVSGCMISEFEITVHENPDMTAQEVIQLFDELQVKYTGSIGYINLGSIRHIFESAGYYISYSTSAAASCEIWNTSVYDRQAAISDYIEVSSYASNGGFKSVLAECNMNNVFAEETISGIANTIKDVFLKDTYDVDNNGEVTSLDALIVLQIVTGINNEDYNADVNNDGEITSQDALEILDIVIK